MYLNCHSFFSFKYGSLPVTELLEYARSMGVSSLALTDINNTSGCLEFIRQAPKYNIRPVVGVDFRKGAHQLYVCVAMNNQGFYEINHFLSYHLETGVPLPARVPPLDNVFVIYPFENGAISDLKENEYMGVKQSDLPRMLFSEWKNRQHKCVLLQTVTFRNKRDFNTHRLLRAIDKNTILSKLPVTEQGKETEVMLTENELKLVFHEYPRMLENARRILDECSIEFAFGQSKNKKNFTGSAATDIIKLEELCEEGIKARYGRWDEVLKERVERELDLIRRQGFSAYFLINWDIVRYAQHKGYFYVGRGSGANSIVAYALRITDVDPIELDLYFERFINEFRVNPPDFDIDFSWKDRDDVTSYIFKTHSRKNTALLATYNTLQSSAVLRELGKVFGLPKSEIDNLVSNRREPDAGDHITKLIYRYSTLIRDFPTHLSIHAGGVLISDEPIHCYTATSLPPKGYPTSQFSMLEAEDIGLYKFDILSQRGLGHIKDAVELVKKNQGIDIDIRDIPKFKEDEKIKEHLRKGRTMGCFYVESPAMRMLLGKLEADTYLALVAASSIIRPGVAQSGMMRAYIERFRNPEKRKYIHPKMQELMEETYGIMVYQEDVIKVAHHFAGMTLGEADVLRRGMSGKYRGREEFQKARDKFIQGCRSKGYDDKLTMEVWRQVESFAGYSFSKGHSASYAVESYQSMYLKAYFPLEFMVGVINNFGGFYSTEFYIHEARMCGGNIHAPCVNHSEYFTCIYGKDIYLGLVHMSEFEQKAAELLVNERLANGAYKSLPDFIGRVNISLEQLRILIRIGAFRFTGRTKKELLWDMFALLGHNRKTDPKRELFKPVAKEFSLPELSYASYEDAMDEMEILGYPLSSPFELLGEYTPTNLNMADLRKHVGKNIVITGYFVCLKYTYTIKREEMIFATFLDSEGCFFDTTHFPQVAKKYRFRGKGCYLLKGRVAEEFGYPSIEVHEMEKLELKKEMQEA